MASSPSDLKKQAKKSQSPPTTPTPVVHESRFITRTESTILTPTVQDQVATGTIHILSSPHVTHGPGRIYNAPVPSVFRDGRGEIHRLRIASSSSTTTDPPNIQNLKPNPTTDSSSSQMDVVDPIHNDESHSSNTTSTASLSTVTTTNTSTSTTTTTTLTTTTRVNILRSKAEIMRSGYLHPLRKRGVVLLGKVEVWTLTTLSTAKQVYTVGETFDIAPYVPHIVYNVESSVVAEWWDEERSGDLKCWYYHPYRRIVDVQNGLIAPSLGQFHMLVPQPHDAYRKATAATTHVSSRRSSSSSVEEEDQQTRQWLTLGFGLGFVTGTTLTVVAVLFLNLKTTMLIRSSKA